MPRPAFSATFRTYGAWLKGGDRTTKYAQEIIKKHALFPDRNLAFLNNLKLSEVYLDKVPKGALTEVEGHQRAKAFDLLREMRKDPSLSFSKAMKKANYKSVTKPMNEATYRKHLGNTLFKKGARWAVRKTDKIPARMRIFSNGEYPLIDVKNSKDRQKIGQYHSDIRSMKYNKIGMAEFSEKYKNIVIIDSNGKKWKLENDPVEIAKKISENRSMNHSGRFNGISE